MEVERDDAHGVPTQRVAQVDGLCIGRIKQHAFERLARGGPLVLQVGVELVEVGRDEPLPVVAGAQGGGIRRRLTRG